MKAYSTYGNNCLRAGFGVSLLYEGACKTAGPDKCSKLNTQELCTAGGGSWQLLGGIAQQWGCRCSLSDANKKCQDSSKCLGRCITKLGTVTSGDNDISGECQPHTPYFGCFSVIEEGGKIATLCID